MKQIKIKITNEDNLSSDYIRSELNSILIDGTWYSIDVSKQDFDTDTWINATIHEKNNENENMSLNLPVLEYFEYPSEDQTELRQFSVEIKEVEC